eukprot:CAMPEP_0119547718 /NCGR_PEP_ID=MMETSP1352-20130426/1769_1 /TAXON_ID=265584 /ORGANISM="Stauroneis constricta, Strain CCMP1120" /LENGTH=1268 /DNA_ID=CAMNT_0007592725 /DNA_START=239 /DNA_END=4045 /DNA_ORIENTATION=+
MTALLQIGNFGSVHAASINEQCLASSAERKIQLPSGTKQLYKIGVLAIRGGVESVYTNWNSTFATYLTQAVGDKFDPPIQFELHPMTFARSIVDDAIASASGLESEHTFDFEYVNPSIHSCMESEIGVQPLVTVINQRRVGDQVYNLDTFGGVIFTTKEAATAASDAGERPIKTIADLRDRSVACVSITGLGSGQMQFQELQKEFPYMQGLKQLLFVGNQQRVVDVVLNGTVDVGFVRTDQLERSSDLDGNPLDLSKVKILNIQDNVKDSNGNDFPFDVSTSLFPEWTVAALPHVSRLISREVQDALLRLSEIAALHDPAANATSPCASSELVQLAFQAKQSGRFDSFRTALSYMQLRNMQEQTGFINVTGTTPKCARTTNVYDAIVCPEGYRKKSRTQVDDGCSNIGLECHGYPCVCKPCDLIKVCGSGKMDVFGECTSIAVVITSTVLPVLAAVLIVVWIYVRHVQYQADTLWKIPKGELVVASKPQVLGRGTFGYVILAEYRGTKVAVKRVLPPKSRPSNSEDGFRMMSPLDSEDDSCGSKRSSKPSEPLHSVRKAKAKAKKSSIDEETGKKERFGFTSGYYPTKHGRSLTTSVSTTGSLFNRSRSSISYSREYKRLQYDFMEEMRQISKLRHPCITTVMGAVIQARAEPMLVMEYMELGSLHSLLHNSTVALERRMAIELIRDVAQGIRFLHAATPQIIHGDLKSLNVLVEKNFRAKIADFGFSQKHALRKKAAGTPFWMAPELLRNESMNTPESDVYAFGILLYEVFSRKDPYHQEQHHHVKILKMIADNNIQKRPPIPDDCPLEIKFLMRECFRDDPTMRPSAESIDQRLRQIEDGGSRLVRKQEEQAPSGDVASLRRFPPHISKAMKAGKKIEPKTHPSASVLCCQVVDHAALVSSFPPEKVVRLMSIVNKTVDNLCKVHDVFRIETVGDEMLIVGNVATEQHDHATIMANFGLEVMESLTEISFANCDDDDGAKERRNDNMDAHAGSSSANANANANSNSPDVDSSQSDEEADSGEFFMATKGCPGNSREGRPDSFARPGSFVESGMLRVRIGMHSGPVVSHVVGTENPRFAILGDAVKLASQLGSCTRPNKLLVSQDFAFELLEAGADVNLQRVDEYSIRRQLGSVSYFLTQGTGRKHLMIGDDTSRSSARTSTSMTSTNFSASSLQGDRSQRVGRSSMRSARNDSGSRSSSSRNKVGAGARAQRSNGVNAIVGKVRRTQQVRMKKRMSSGTLASGSGHLRSDELVMEQIMSSDDEMEP